MRSLIFLILLVLSLPVLVFSQTGAGQVSGVVTDQTGSPLENASVRLFTYSDTGFIRTALTGREGEFHFAGLPHQLYSLEISFTGLLPLRVDSINVRDGKELFSLGSLIMKPGSSTNLAEVIVVAERPLIESKDGNITFNAAESPLAAGATADELLAQVPLVNKDADGKITVRGKEPRILIDDKPVELNLSQLQDLLESMPGSAIEKIEVMQNPPPQYANEQGGVINIVMRKGRVGRTARINVSAGTRGQGNLNGQFTYRKSGLSFSLSAGASYNRIPGEGSSYRENFFRDSTNYFHTSNDYLNKSLRPNLRANIDYTFNKFQSITANVQLNGNDFDNVSETEYRNINRYSETWRLSNREIHNTGNSINGSFNASYHTRTKRAGEQLRIVGSVNLSSSHSDRIFYQQFLLPGVQDSTQWQANDQLSAGWNLRLNYDRPIIDKNTSISIGTFLNRNSSDVQANALYLRKSDLTKQPLDQLSNDFRFNQSVWNLRMGMRRRLGMGTSISAGVSAEETSIAFDLRKTGQKVSNAYWTWLPYANFNHNFKDKLNFTFAYRRSIRRPGINELNPTIDFADPYNIRFGNEKLEASTSDNFDLVLGRTRTKNYINLGLGYNRVRDIFSRVRTLLEDGRTQITWENISGRQEYEVSSWSGLTFSKKLRVNFSASYTYNVYSDFDRRVNKYRNGASFTSNLNSTYTRTDRWNFTGGFSFNRFANPQGFGRWTMSMNTGVQHKMFNKRMTVTLNVIDPFVQQRNFTRTYGPDFYHEGRSFSRTRNFRLTIGYNLLATAPKKKLDLKV
ncbi:MAG: TonB dependent receptor [Chitinophagaceae bacterium]|nr:TonB dependent receptor [Chitinophagaceae bacterium]